MAFEAKVTGGEWCGFCLGTGYNPNVKAKWLVFRELCAECRGHGRTKLTVDVSGYKPPGSLTNLPTGFDLSYDTLKVDPPDHRSPMIRLLDDPAWRESLKVAEAPVEEYYADMRQLYETFFGFRRS